MDTLIQQATRTIAQRVDQMIFDRLAAQRDAEFRKRNPFTPPQEAPMSEPIQFHTGGYIDRPSFSVRARFAETPFHFRDIFIPRAQVVEATDWEKLFGGFIPAKKGPTPAERLEKLDLQNGDLISLTADGAVIQGPIEQIRAGADQVQVRIKGFGETPHGNHNTWFNLEAYELDVLERGFRWTEDDRLIAAFYTITEKEWESRFSEATRGYYRQQGKTRIQRVREILGAAK